MGCAYGRNTSSVLCGECNEGLSELFGSVDCGTCNHTNYALLILILLFFVAPFVIYVAYFDDATKKEILLFKSLIFDIGFYYYQALGIIFSSKGITVSSWFETMLLSIFNL